MPNKCGVHREWGGNQGGINVESMWNKCGYKRGTKAEMLDKMPNKPGIHAEPSTLYTAVQ